MELRNEKIIITILSFNVDSNLDIVCKFDRVKAQKRKAISFTYDGKNYRQPILTDVVPIKFLSCDKVFTTCLTDKELLEYTINIYKNKLISKVKWAEEYRSLDSQRYKDDLKKFKKNSEKLLTDGNIRNIIGYTERK